MALVRKILEATIPSGGLSATFTDSDIPNSLIRVYSTNSNIYPQNISLSGNTLTVTYEQLTSSLGVAVELVKQGLEIDDNLTSDNTDHALSAKQGKVLKGLIDAIPAGITELSELDDVEITDIEDGQVLAWDDVEQKFVNVDQSGGSNTHDFTGEEKIVGTWFGSTLYEKSYVVASLTGSYTIIDNSITCLTAKIRNASMGTFSVGGAYNGAQYVDGRMAFNSFPRIILGSSGLQVGMETPPVDPVTDFNFTIQYTKIS